MWFFGRKKKQEENTYQSVPRFKTRIRQPIQHSKVGDDTELTCLFCGKKFKKNEILFAVTLRYPDPEYTDEVFERQRSSYQSMNAFDKNGNQVGLKTVYRRLIDNPEIIDTEENGLPIKVKGNLHKNSDSEDTTDNLDFDEESIGGNDYRWTEDENDIVSTERICPRCHFTLPEGFATDPVIRVGLIGGSRSGKTTYMAVVTEYLRNKMGSLNSGLELADVELLPECDNYQKALYIQQKGAQGAEATLITGTVKDKMILPMVMHIKPRKEGYDPFFLILQDIPGEYLRPENVNFLLGSTIPQSNALIMLIDINHFINTEQKKMKEFGGYCEQELTTLFNNLDRLKIPSDTLHSVQCTLTKLDFWIQEANGKLDDTVFIHNCDESHRNGIDEDRLDLVHRQIVEKLRNIGNADQSALLDTMIGHLECDENVNTGYTAIASRTVPKYEEVIKANGADYQLSLNVLEPLMNIFAWEDLLPVIQGNNETTK